MKTQAIDLPLPTLDGTPDDQAEVSRSGQVSLSLCVHCVTPLPDSKSNTSPRYSSHAGC